MDELLTQFSHLLSVRLAAGVYTTEDSIRYTFKDLYRLSLCEFGPLTQRLLVYCTDQAMVTYFRNPANAHTAFFDLAKDSRLRIDQIYLADRPPTFTRSLGVELVVDLEALLLEKLPRNHELRVFSVTPCAVQAVVEAQSDE